MNIRNVAGWGALGLGLVALIAGGLRLYEAKLEQPAYRIVETTGDFEIRDYPAVLVAETTVSGERGRALSAGFQRLADYIFGNDEEKIAMTVPVFSDSANGAWRTRFVMPGRFTAATLPAMPTGVSAAELPPRRMAVVRFSGSGSDAQIAEQEARLRAWLSARALNADGDAVAAFYNSPFVPGPLRRSEVMIAVG